MPHTHATEVVIFASANCTAGSDAGYQQDCQEIADNLPAPKVRSVHRQYMTLTPQLLHREESYLKAEYMQDKQPGASGICSDACLLRYQD